MNHNKAAIILAAGKGTRMKSSLPKVMHAIANKPMINHVIDSCDKAGIDDIAVVIGPDMDNLKNAVTPARTIIQEKALGTGHAVQVTKDAFKDFKGYVFILTGDTPFITPETLEKLYLAAQKTDISVLGFRTDNPSGYGRLIIQGDHVDHIVEEKDCDDLERQITFCNAGVYCVESDLLYRCLEQLNNDNAQGEYYLTDIIEHAKAMQENCSYYLADITEAIGINSRAQLAEAEKIMQQKLRQNAMDKGVTMIDPETVFLSMDTQFENDITIEPNVYFGKGVSVGAGTVIHAFSHLEGVEIGKNASIGPFARLRPKSKIGDHVTVGNFIEVNRSEMKTGAKSKHVSYLGDAIIGEKTNIGAGTIIANYDGFNKQETTIGAGAFIGSNSTIIAPLTIGEGAIVAAGSTITHNINANDLGVARAKQTVSEGWAIGYRERNKKDSK